ncbi:hypothetical protein QBC34DRAFT_496521 [Podospora aff. communis PSN243]|uniref:Uncharacterized protein n=1 Tax=Podospora aff. communis PSN243 TaxID=3040156 RepID=A0AAV9GFL1_9PEZI|nr:hypothetical protein QBC34DRAFT_496521 [Podospora aff. communis PSN243]
MTTKMTSPAPNKRSYDSGNTTPRKRHRSSTHAASGNAQHANANATRTSHHTPNITTATTPNTGTITQMPSPPSTHSHHIPKPSQVLGLGTVVHCLEAPALTHIVSSIPEDELRTILTAYVSQSANASSTLAQKVATTYDATHVAEPKPTKHICFDDMVQDTIIAPLRRFAGDLDAAGLVALREVLQLPAGPWANVRLLHAQALPGESFATRADALVALVAICEFLAGEGMLEREKTRVLLDGPPPGEGPVGRAFVEICEGMTEVERSAVVRLTVVGGEKMRALVNMFHERGVMRGVVEGYKLLVKADGNVCVSAVAFGVHDMGEGEHQEDGENGEMDGDEGVSLIGPV